MVPLKVGTIQLSHLADRLADATSRFVTRLHGGQATPCIEIATQYGNHRLTERESAAGQHDERTLARNLEGEQLSSHIDLVQTGIRSRVRSKDDPGLRENRKAIRHRFSRSTIHSGE